METIIKNNGSLSQAQIEIKGRAYLSDPCYLDERTKKNALGRVDESEIRGMVSLGDATGSWIIEAETVDEGFWGKRVSELTGTNTSVKQANRHERKTESHEIFVDAGLFGIVPESVVGYEWSEFCEELFGLPHYDDQLRQLFEVKGVVCSSTGLGDGTYLVKVERNELDQVRSFEIQFLDQDEDNGYDY